MRHCSSAKFQLGHSFKTESDAAGFGNTIFRQIFPLCCREPFVLLPKLVASNGGYHSLHLSLVFVAAS